MMILSWYVETIKIIQYQMSQVSLENANTSEMKVISSLLIKHSFIFWLYVTEDVIQEVYESNFGTADETYKGAAKKGSSIKLQNVKGYLAKRDGIQVKTKPRGSNSFVSPGAKFEFEIDIMGILARDGVGIRYGMVAIDRFIKIAEVIPIKNRQPTELISALKPIFQSMGKPRQLYSDGESSFRANVFFRFIMKMILNIFKQALMHLLLEDLSEHPNTIYIEGWMV